MRHMKLQELKDAGLNTGELIVRIGSGFLKTPYVAETLEGKKEENLTVNFSHFDCFTFMETTLALALGNVGNAGNHVVTQSNRRQIWERP